ncbi:MAG: NYN domain-containing protein [Planctomycetes bacterium]|nr:NYN domain-containing protein [Planctomycetota bacterium]
MSSYLIDGYNLLHALGILGGKVGPRGLQRARNRLLNLLAEAFGAESDRVNVVFDAAGAPPKGVEGSTTHKGIRVEFAIREPTADDFIEGAIAAHKQPKELIVVSSDARLQGAARRRGAKPMACAEFLDHLDELRRPRQARPEQPERGEHRMSQRETERWLREFAGLEDEPELKEALKPFDFEVEKE